MGFWIVIRLIKIFIFINEQFEHTLYTCPIIKDTFGNPLPLPTDSNSLVKVSSSRQ